MKCYTKLPSILFFKMTLWVRCTESLNRATPQSTVDKIITHLTKEIKENKICSYGVTAHGVCLRLYLQRGQFTNNVHCLQTDSNYFSNQFDDMLRIVCTVRVVDDTTAFVCFYTVLVYYPL